MNEIDKTFEKEAMHRGGLVLYSREVTLQIIHKCKNLKINILGIDGFYIMAEETHSKIEDIIDFSYSQDQEKNYVDAEQFVRRRPSNMFFELVHEEI